jgi:hypothetical protein
MAMGIAAAAERGNENSHPYRHQGGCREQAVLPPAGEIEIRIVAAGKEGRVISRAADSDFKRICSVVLLLV